MRGIESPIRTPSTTERRTSEPTNSLKDRANSERATSEPTNSISREGISFPPNGGRRVELDAPDDQGGSRDTSQDNSPQKKFYDAILKLPDKGEKFKQRFQGKSQEEITEIAEDYKSDQKKAYEELAKALPDPTQREKFAQTFGKLFEGKSKEEIDQYITENYPPKNNGVFEQAVQQRGSVANRDFFVASDPVYADGRWYQFYAYDTPIPNNPNQVARSVFLTELEVKDGKVSSVSNLLKDKDLVDRIGRLVFGDDYAGTI